MADEPGGDGLSARCNLALVLRLVLGPSGGVVGGEVVDSDGELQARFSGRSGLHRVLDRWLDRLEHGRCP